MRELHDPDAAGAIVVGTVPNVATTDPVMIVVGANDDGFGCNVGELPSSSPATL